MVVCVSRFHFRFLFNGTNRMKVNLYYLSLNALHLHSFTQQRKKSTWSICIVMFNAFNLEIRISSVSECTKTKQSKIIIESIYSANALIQTVYRCVPLCSLTYPMIAAIYFLLHPIDARNFRRCVRFITIIMDFLIARWHFSGSMWWLLLPENRSTVIVDEALRVSQVCGLLWKVRCVWCWWWMLDNP